MREDRLVTGLTTLFAATTAFAVLAGVALLEPTLFVVAAPLAVATVLFWYHASGRLQERVRRSQSGRNPGGQGRPGGRGRPSGGFGAGPRRGSEGSRGRRTRAGWEGRRQRQGPRENVGNRRSETSMRPAEAYRRLGLEVGADEEAVKRAYREKVKAVHPDRGGDEETFREINEAYETLTG